jgi:hypothetical protein
MQPTYWLDLFTHETWGEFLAAGATISGFRENRWKTAQSMKPGDVLLCYLTGVSRWIGLLEVTGPAFKDSSPIWSVADFPVRVPVKLIAQLEPLHGVPVIDMRDRLSIFQNLKSPHAWTGRFRGSPYRWGAADGEAVVKAVQDAMTHPVERPFDASKLKKVPPILKMSKLGAVTVPDDEELKQIEVQYRASEAIAPFSATEDASETTITLEPKEASAHTEIQWLLLKLGSDMGLDVWVAKNDKSKVYNGYAFTSLPRLKQSLPLQFDEATTRTIELIDVIWLKGNSIQAAFEIESTTSIFSGLLRMSDLITMQPNLNIPLYIVAPGERRNKVLAEVNRPTFARLTPPMSEMCRYISFEELRRRLDAAKSFLQFLKPEFLDSFSESCEIEDI